MRLEDGTEPLATIEAFRRRYFRYVLLAAAVFAGSVALGMIGFHVFAGMSWLDAFVNTVMMLTTMGPIDPLLTPEARLFGAFFALYSSLVFVATAGILIAPLLHRLLHRFHIKLLDDGDD
jgi:hypothetical protein